MEVIFPLYRKYSTQKTWFKITGYESFEEIKILGNFYNIRPFTATTFVDRNLIMDMIENKEGQWEECSSKEYSETEQLCRNQLRQKNSL